MNPLPAAIDVTFDCSSLSLKSKFEKVMRRMIEAMHCELKTVVQSLSQFFPFPHWCAQADADSFYMACNGRQFNSIEDDVCQLVYVERAEVLKSEDVSMGSSCI